MTDLGSCEDCRGRLSGLSAKGEDRPLVPQEERLEVVAALDGVLLFAEDTVAGVIEALRPEVHAKGVNHAEETVPEREVVLAYGGEVRIVGDPKGHSTASLAKRLRSSDAG